MHARPAAIQPAQQGHNGLGRPLVRDVGVDEDAWNRTQFDGALAILRELGVLGSPAPDRRFLGEDITLRRNLDAGV